MMILYSNDPKLYLLFELPFILTMKNITLRLGIQDLSILD